MRTEYIFVHMKVSVWHEDFTGGLKSLVADDYECLHVSY